MDTSARHFSCNGGAQVVHLTTLCVINVLKDRMSEVKKENHRHTPSIVMTISDTQGGDPDIPVPGPDTRHIEVWPIYPGKANCIVWLKEVQTIEHNVQAKPVEETMERLGR